MAVYNPLKVAGCFSFGHEERSDAMREFEVGPRPDDERLTRRVAGRDESGAEIDTTVTVERPLTVYLNSQEIVTMMTIGDHPKWLAVGYLLNQNMLRRDDRIEGIDCDEELDVVVVRTERPTNYEAKLRKKTLTSGCAQGTAFGDLMETFEDVTLATDAVLHTAALAALLKKVNTQPSLYLEAGAIHGCVLAHNDVPLLYLEDVGRHNAVDKIFYTTGRLTSEMVIKCVNMRIPILVSRSGFTAWGVDLARQANLTLVGRARGRRFIALSGHERIVYDADVSTSEDGGTQEAAR